MQIILSAITNEQIIAIVAIVALVLSVAVIIINAIRNHKLKKKAKANIVTDEVSPIEDTVVAPIEGEVVAPIEGEVVAPIEGEVVALVEGEVVAPIEGEEVALVEGEVVAPIEGEVVAPIVETVAAPVVMTVAAKLAIEKAAKLAKMKAAQEEEKKAAAPVVEKKAAAPKVVAPVAEKKAAAPKVVAPVAEKKVAAPKVVKAAPVVVEEVENEKKEKIAFSDAMIASSDKTKALYNELKNEIMSYEDVTSYVGVKGETFKYDGNIIAKAIYDEKLIFGFDVNKALANNYPIATISEEKRLADAKLAFIIKSKVAVKTCIELLSDIVVVEYDLVKKAKKNEVDYASKL